jgi:hypothetical protein
MALEDCSGLLGGIPKDCRGSKGGLKLAYLFRLYEIASKTVVDGVVTALSLESGAVLAEYNFRKNSSSFTETITAADVEGTTIYTPEITLQFTKLETSKRNEILLLSQNDLVAIVLDRNGTYWMLGYNNGLILGGDAQTGTAMGDFNGYNITLTGEEELPMLEVQASVIEGLLA